MWALSQVAHLICCKTVIGFGGPNKQGTEESHGSPLGDAAVALARVQLGWKPLEEEAPLQLHARVAAAARSIVCARPARPPTR